MSELYDVIVVGGGLSGVAAAVAAARQGMKALLVEQAGFLGGAPGTCLVNPFMPFSTPIEENGEQHMLELCRGIFREICQEMEALGAYQNRMFHEEYLKLVLDRMTAKAGVSVLLHSTLCGVTKEDGAIRSVSVVSKSGVMTFAGRYFVDATGDADLAIMAGCPYRLGREEDGLCQPMTLCFRLANVDMDKFKENRAKITPLYQQFQKEGKLRNPRENVLIFFHPVKNTLHFNTTRVIKLNPVNPFDLTRAEMEAREQMFEMYDFLKANIPGFEHSDLSFSAPFIGVRESRMIDGEYILTVEDLKACTKFEDAIAAGNYDVDIHNPAGAGTSHYYFPAGVYYTIPYRSLAARGVANLLVAGRCISVTHEAQASIRIMPICTCLGEAAGVAASVAARDDAPVSQANVRLIQETLQKNGAFIGI